MIMLKEKALSMFHGNCRSVLPTNGRNFEYGPQKLENKLLTTYFNYNKTLEAINSTVMPLLDTIINTEERTPFYLKLNT
jgi:iron complex outermembrane receptor protein